MGIGLGIGYLTEKGFLSVEREGNEESENQSIYEIADQEERGNCKSLRQAGTANLTFIVFNIILYNEFQLYYR